MNYTESALATLIARVSYAAEMCLSTMKELRGWDNFATPTEARASRMLKDLHNELQSALLQARPAITTEPPTSGRTRSTPTSTATQEAIAESAKEVAASMRTTVYKLLELSRALTTSSDGSNG